MDEQNYISPKVLNLLYPLYPSVRPVSKWARYQWKLINLRIKYHDFVYKLKYGFKLPKDMCCWNMNVCYDVECKNCGYSYWACAYCGHTDPCVNCKKK